MVVTRSRLPSTELLCQKAVILKACASVSQAVFMLIMGTQVSQHVYNGTGTTDSVRTVTDELRSGK